MEKLLDRNAERFETTIKISHDLAGLLNETLKYLMDLTDSLEVTALATTSEITAKGLRYMGSKIHNHVIKQTKEIITLNELLQKELSKDD